MLSATFRWRNIRLLIWTALALILIGWGFTDVRNRGRWDPARPMNHMTDLTVYTVAGAAFFDGRDPYAVANPRGWHYLYPPLLAIVLAPLSKIDSQWQVVIWYFFNVALAAGCCYESLRLLRLFNPVTPNSPSTKADVARNNGNSIHAPGLLAGAPIWLVISAAGAMLLPMLNCLQRGQVGILITYLVLLGLRLVLGGRTWRGWAAGGIVLALAITVKLTPIMPALFLAAAMGLPAVMRWKRNANPPARSAPAIALLGGMAAGLMLFLFLLPAVAVGWSANVRHLHRFVDLIVLNHDVGGENDLTYRSVRNQSLENAVYRLGNWMAYAWCGGPSDLAEAETQPPMPMDHPIVHRTLIVVRLGLLALLAVVGWRAAKRGGPLDFAAAYGAACVATLLVSPLSWGHHYLIAAPGTLIVPLWFWQRGQTRAAKALAYSSFALMWGHYLLLDWTARAGMLGIGTTIWFLAAAIGMLRGDSATGAAATGNSDPRANSGAKTSPELRAA